jgi:hypothetical protein
MTTPGAAVSRSPNQLDAFIFEYNGDVHTSA